jgi:hypothetical protein
MTRDDYPTESAGPTTDATRATLWPARPSAKARGGVQRAVTGLLDALAPERVMSRVPRLPGPVPVPVERHRTPRGCVLQAGAAAVSVTWFPAAAADPTMGELQVTVWRGVVSRPGSAHRAPGGASVVRELVFVPIEDGVGGWAWRAADGTTYDTDWLVEQCATLLEQQVTAVDR